jgi:hypothetical protein
MRRPWTSTRLRGVTHLKMVRIVLPLLGYPYELTPVPHVTVHDVSCGVHFRKFSRTIFLNANGTCCHVERGHTRYASRRTVPDSSPHEFIEIFQFIKSFRPYWTLEFTQPQTPMSTREHFWGDSWQPRRHLLADYQHSVGSSASHNPIGLRGLLRE